MLNQAFLRLAFATFALAFLLNHYARAVGGELLVKGRIKLLAKDHFAEVCAYRRACSILVDNDATIADSVEKLRKLPHVPGTLVVLSDKTDAVRLGIEEASAVPTAALHPNRVDNSDIEVSCRFCSNETESMYISPRFLEPTPIPPGTDVSYPLTRALAERFDSRGLPHFSDQTPYLHLYYVDDDRSLKIAYLTREERDSAIGILDDMYYVGDEIHKLAGKLPTAHDSTTTRQIAVVCLPLAGIVVLFLWLTRLRRNDRKSET